MRRIGNRMYGRGCAGGYGIAVVYIMFPGGLCICIVSVVLYIVSVARIRFFGGEP